ncbi:putative transporter [Eikenella sp. S3360]|uniref:Transporter n=1 Tax=Eikenella glucosivorans TaxID=2766967 RepID=A0ABS0ND35_9NEIS|nr:putative transporter [Eikenella glucosivorans]MBH5330176.1 putative transporter [Eikenella glucosivorans]
MFRSFFLSRRWLRWSAAGTLLILAATWYRVQLNVQINDWFGTFYDSVQKMLEKPGSVSLEEFNRQVFTFARIAGIYILVVVVGSFINKHYVFRWRTAMTEYYMRHWPLLRDIEGASQRIQEDTMRFATIMESLGESGLRAILTLVAFLPILWKLSEPITELPLVGHVDHSLVYVAILASLLGTVALVAVGCKLPGLEFDNQKVEAAYRKELVLGEDDAARADAFTLTALFQNVRRNYFRLYWHYLYFDVARYSYLQFSVVLPYLAMGPALVAGTVALGVMQQIVRAFGQVLEAFQFLVRSWPTIVELMSIYKRLKAFEHNIVGRLGTE